CRPAAPPGLCPLLGATPPPPRLVHRRTPRQRRQALPGPLLVLRACGTHAAGRENPPAREDIFSTFATDHPPTRRPMAVPSLDPAVSTPASDQALADGSLRSSGDASVSVAERLAGELASAWREGERLRVEELLALHPDLHADSEVTLRLLYEELCLRQEMDEAVPQAEVLRRFPHLGTEVGRLLECHRVLQPPPPPRFPEVGETLGGFR